MSGHWTWTTMEERIIITNHGHNPELYHNTSTHTGTGIIRSCHLGKLVRKTTWEFWEICLSTALPWLIQTTFTEKAFQKLFACRLADRPDEAWIQALYKATLWYCYFSVLLIQLLQSDHREISLFWVHTVVVKQMNSVYLYLPVSNFFIDFNILIKKPPLTRDGWTGALQLRTGHQSASGSW